MQIDRSNYEVWFIDWLDGNLNSHQVEQLKLFLDQNHDLREEFDDLIPLNLVSSGISFRHKENLKKSPSHISPHQFDYLCAAYLENDLSESQKAELQEIVNMYPVRKKTFDLIQKTILAPAGISYSHKNRLLRRTSLQNVIRLSAIGLSAAAAISIILIIYSVIPGTGSLKQSTTAHNLLSDSIVQRPSKVMAKERIITDSVPLPAEKKKEKRLASINKKENVITNPEAVVSKTHILPPTPQGGYRKMPSFSKSPLGDLGVNLSGRVFNTTSSDDSSLRIIDKLEEAVIKVPVNPEVDLGKDLVSNTLIEATPTINTPDIYDERSQAGKFISKTFREKLLKEKTPGDTPLKGYEIAEAGIAGLNKLFGWQMALTMKNDVKGQPQSVYFTSQILKVSAPVKKREVQQ